MHQCIILQSAVFSCQRASDRALQKPNEATLVCVCVCVRACVRACVRVCVRLREGGRERVAFGMVLLDTSLINTSVIVIVIILLWCVHRGRNGNLHVDCSMGMVCSVAAWSWNVRMQMRMSALSMRGELGWSCALVWVSEAVRFC